MVSGIITDFVAIDFETINSRSACSVGLVKYDINGEVDYFHSFIRPHDTEKPNPFATKKHTVTPEMYMNAPEWDVVRESVVEFIGDLPLVAHNMSSDCSVMRKMDITYGFNSITNDMYCTQRNFESLTNKTLHKFRLIDIYNYLFPNEVFKEHDALEDARACAKIFYYLQHEYEYEPFVYILNVKSQTNAKNSGNSRAKNINTLEELLEKYTNKYVISGKNIVVTGASQYAQRSVLKEFFTALGASVQDNVTKTTDLLIAVNPSGTSKKVQKAKEMQNNGHHIIIMSENELFKQLIRDE